MDSLLPQRGPRPFPTDRVAMLGHSEGGGSAIVAASRDQRIRGAINWDGTIQGSPDFSGLTKSQPVMFFYHDFGNPAAGDPTWLAMWPQILAAKLIVRVGNTTHQTFSDVPTLLEAAGQSTKPLADVLGTIDPAQMVRIVIAYTTEWMNGAFAGKEGGALLKGQEPDKFPEVSITLRANFQDM
ncbi:hypothetical protein BT63DRAFT_175996 [Microthyrium microscopicum]|uniref:1-alkyl-2-acetylglycerophosphocholine esterase n=1 Tax=Microthyrium microscopicum TaxID=703497 RepID=A0A6A6UJJ6_9PEZI|nr:hypothetical protein BT63DRAFT_175996 [Microthyrium microscopicum]